MKGQTRVQTKYNIVIVTHTTFKDDGDGGDGDFDQSIRYYGPFESADEQRAFMRGIFLEAPMEEAERQRMLDVVDNWRRCDEKPS